MIAGLFLFGIFLLGLGVLSFALWFALKLLEWALRLGLWLINKYAEPEPLAGDIVISIVDDAECEDMPRTMRDVTPREMRRIKQLRDR
jgi:hypothetical protein